jgi:hypothetical protein
LIAGRGWTSRAMVDYRDLCCSLDIWHGVRAEAWRLLDGTSFLYSCDVGGRICRLSFSYGNDPDCDNLGVGMWLGVLALSALAFLSMRLYIPYVLFAAGISLIFFSFLTSLMLFVPLFVVGILLFLASLASGFLLRNLGGGKRPGGPDAK